LTREHIYFLQMCQVWNHYSDWLGHRIWSSSDHQHLCICLSYWVKYYLSMTCKCHLPPFSFEKWDSWILLDEIPLPSKS
jgi:hypothetical protein